MASIGHGSPEGSGQAQRLVETAKVFMLRDFHGSEPGEMIVLYLAVEELEIPLLDMLDEVDQADLRGVGHATEHGLAHERGAQRDAV